MDSKAFEKILQDSEPMWDGKFPSIAKSAGSGELGGPRPTATYDEKLWYVGWTDGATGQQPDEGVKLIQAHDADRNHRLAFELNRRKTRAESRATACQQRIERTSLDLEQTRGELADLETRRRRDPQEFSIVTGALYVLIALILILSDMPLSLSLVAEGFDMPVSYQMEDSDETILLGDIFSEHWAGVIQHLWQPIILAIGIACLGIFFKIVTDYFLSSIEAAPEDPRFALLFKSLRRTFFVLAFALMLGGLWSVGRLRASQQSLLATQDESLRATPTDAEVAKEREQRRVVDLWTNRSFIALAITLPLIGGICFSVGWKRIQRFGQLWMARVLSIWRGWRIDRLREKHGISASEATFLGQQIERATTREASVDPTALSIYMHGYWRGFTMPQKLEPHRSLYVHCKDVLQQWIAAGVQETTMGRSLKFGRGRK